MTLPNEDIPLSPMGEARKEALRATLSREMSRVVRRRRIRRRATSGAAVIVVIVAGAWWLNHAARINSPQPPIAHAPVESMPELIQIQYFADNPGITEVARLDVRIPVTQVTLSDEELLEALADIGRPTGLARIGSRVVVTSAVTDPLPHVADPPARPAL